MKISRPTNDTITSMTAVRGSRTQPSSSHTSPNWNQRKLKTCRDTSPFPECCQAFAKARQDKIRATPIEPIASEAANLRCRCFAKEETPAANSGKAGMSQRYRIIQFIMWVLEQLSFHRVYLVHIGRFVMPVNRND